MPTIRTSAYAAGDRAIASTSTTYATARAGNGTRSATELNSTSDVYAIGQTKGGGGLTSDQYQVLQAGFRFTHPGTPANTELVSAWFHLNPFGIWGTKRRTLEIKLHGGFENGVYNNDDFVAGDLLGQLTTLGVIRDVNSSWQSYYPMCGSHPNLIERLNSTSAPIHAVVSTDRVRNGAVPTDDERLGLNWSNRPGEHLDPLLVQHFLTSSNLTRVQGASAQLSDGTSVFVTRDGGSLTLMYSQDNVTDHEIAALDNGFDAELPSRQLVSLAVDASDNIWVVGKSADGDRRMIGQAFIKGAGYTWAVRPAQRWETPSYAGAPINNVAIAWHPTSNLGHLVVFISHRAGTDGYNGQLSAMTVSCNNLQAGVGGYVAYSYSDVFWPLAGLSPQMPNAQYINDLSTGLDLISDGEYGIAMFVDGSVYMGYSTWKAPRAKMVRYRMSTAGELLASGSDTREEPPVTQDITPDTKAKLIYIDSDRYGVAYGEVISVYSWSGSRLAVGALGDASWFDNPNIDWFYDPAQSRIWCYTLNASLEVWRVGFSLITYTWGNWTQVGTVGTTGDTPVGLRLPRGPVNERTVRIEAALRSSTGDHSVVTIQDAALNLEPSSPDLFDRPAFDAASPAAFSWSFSDDNTGDAQTAYELEITRQSDGVLVYDTGKVFSSAQSHTVPASTLSNDQAYYWRVRVWDLADAVSAWSQQGSFSTLSTAITTITSPGADNSDEVTSSSHLVTWSTTKITQARYRMRVVATQNGSVLLDTGYVTTTQTARQVTGLQDGTEYEITVWVRNNVDVESEPGTRLITPHYAQPPVPEVQATPGDGWVLVTVNNPEPGEGEAETQYNEVWRSPAGEDAFIRIATIPANGQYRDYNVRSGHDYEYYVEAI